MANFQRGAKRSPMHRVLAAPQHVAVAVPPPQVAYVPQKLSMWDNDRDGDCVTAESAFGKACHSPEIFIPDQVVIDWATRHGVLNGATLVEVLDAMQSDGFVVGSQKYDEGPYSSVDYSNETILQSAIALGPVKIAIDANALPSTAGSQQGWHAVGGSPGQFSSTDHCVSVAGYGPSTWLYQQLGVPPPPALGSGYLVYTWSTIGFVDHAWLMSTCVEAWVRNPTTVGVPPLTPVPPGPGPTPGPAALFTVTVNRAIRKGGAVSFTAPVAIPTGQWDWAKHATVGDVVIE